MSEIEDDGYSLENHVQGESRNLDAALMRLDLNRELDEVKQAAPYRDKGQCAKTLVRNPDLRVVLVALAQGVSMGEHQTNHRITVQCLHGEVRVKLPDQQVDLPAGCLFTMLGSVPHDVEGLRDSAFLL